MSKDAVPVELTVGQTVGDLILAELPASTRLALQRCSLAAAFSEACYDAVLRGPDGPAQTGRWRAPTRGSAPRWPR